jgi:hypothetical protein
MLVQGNSPYCEIDETLGSDRVDSDSAVLDSEDIESKGDRRAVINAGARFVISRSRGRSRTSIPVRDARIRLPRHLPGG